MSRPQTPSYPETRSRPETGAGRVRIPGDIDRPDRILGGLTARQLAILAVTALVLWAAYTATHRLVPIVVFGAVAAPVTAAGVVAAVGRFGGVPADRWLLAAWQHRRAPRRLVPAPDGIPTGPDFAGNPGPVPAPLRLPFAGVTGDGIVDLGGDGWALICRASAVTFSLRTPDEQEALVAGFARWLNSLPGPVQIVVRAEPVDLAPAINRLVDLAPSLPHPALEVAARAHAQFLTDLAGRRDLLRREVLVVLRETSGDDPAGRLHRRARDAAAALAAAGVTVTALGAPAAAGCLAQAVDPANPHPAGRAAGTDRPVTVAANGGTR